MRPHVERGAGPSSRGRSFDPCLPPLLAGLPGPGNGRRRVLQVGKRHHPGHRHGLLVCHLTTHLERRERRRRFPRLVHRWCSPPGRAAAAAGELGGSPVRPRSGTHCACSRCVLMHGDACCRRLRSASMYNRCAACCQRNIVRRPRALIISGFGPA